jgi:hypothetical protein
MKRNLNFLQDLNQLVDLIKKELNEEFNIGMASESGDIDIVLQNMKYDFNHNMKILNFICENLPKNIKYAYLSCGNDEKILDDIKKNKITKSNYTKFQYYLIKKFESRSKMRQLWYQSKSSLLRWKKNEVDSKKDILRKYFEKTSTFILNLVGINSETDFTPLQFVIYSTKEKTFFNQFNMDDHLDNLLWKYFKPTKKFNFSYYAEMRLHYLKYFKSETHEKWLFEKIKNDIFNFKIPKNIDYDTYEKLIYKIQKIRKKNNFSLVISNRSSYEFDSAFIENKKLFNYFNDNTSQIRYFYFFKMYVFNLLGYNLSRKQIAVTFKRHLLNSKKLPFKLRNLSKNDISYLTKISNNPYYLTYFNNLTWQVLPLPWNEIGNVLLASYSRRNKYKLGFTLNKYNIGIGNQSSRTYFKNLETKNETELLTSLNVEKFNPKNFPSKCDYIIIADNIIYLGNNLHIIFEYPFSNKFLSINCKYEKELPKQMKVPCEENPAWKKLFKNLKIDFNDISYISVMKKLNANDLKGIFLFDNLTKNIKLYHNTQISGNKETYEKLLDQTTFFAFSNKYDSKYFVDGTKCITYGLINDVKDLLLLGLNISKINRFNLDNKLKIEKKKSLIFNSKDKLFKYVDLGNNKQYEGRRKLQELIFGTRQFVPSEIYNNECWGQKIKEINHPEIKRCAMSYDAVYLSQIDIEGFIADDFKFAFDTGGELLLTHPKKYVKIININDYKCSKLDT